MTLPARLFELHPTSGVPIYRQIVDQVRALVAGGQPRPGDLLPSVRQVAQAAEINPMTVSKAYSRLEIEGLVERVRGQGMRVLAPAVVGRLPDRKEEFAELLAPAIHRARQLGLTDEQIRRVLETLLAESEPITSSRQGSRR
jgi:GntR family transcriptional regulator